MVDAVSGAGASAGASSSLSGSQQTIAGNFETFLQLLTTQLQTQNPLDPLDTNQFTQQLVQFSSVEQQLKTNEFLEAMMQANASSADSRAVSFIGKDVSASGTQATLANGQAKWSFNADAASDNALITIKDESGSVVFSQKASLNEGPDELVWDGTTSNGTRLTSGKFTISIDARTAEGQVIPVSTETTGTVTSVDMSGEEPVLVVDGSRIPLSLVSKVSQPAV